MRPTSMEVYEVGKMLAELKVFPVDKGVKKEGA